jgi:hypothetical protein
MQVRLKTVSAANTKTQGISPWVFAWAISEANQKPG